MTSILTLYQVARLIFLLQYQQVSFFPYICSIQVWQNPSYGGFIIIAKKIWFFRKLDEIKRLSNKYKYNPVWIGGDFNLLDIDWETKSINESQCPTALNESFLETLNLCKSDQLVNFTTRKNHTLELLITNKPSFIEKCLPIPGIADHDNAISVDTAGQPKYSEK